MNVNVLVVKALLVLHAAAFFVVGLVDVVLVFIVVAAAIIVVFLIVDLFVVFVLFKKLLSYDFLYL